MPLDWNSLYYNRLLIKARISGRLVYAMDQLQTPPMEETGPWGSIVQARAVGPSSPPESSGTSVSVPGLDWVELGPPIAGGYCVGLSLAWLVQRRKGSDFNYDKGSKICNYPPWEATQLHNLYKQPSRKGTVGWREYHYREEQCIRHAANHVGLRLDAQGYRAGRKVNFADIFANAPEFGLPPLSASKETLPRGLMLISLTRFMPHCVAMDHTDGAIRFFEPNLGQFMFKDQEDFFYWSREYISSSSFREYDLTQVYRIV